MQTQPLAWRLTEAMLGLPPDRLISWARAILAGFALVAIYLDPSQPAYNAPIAYVVMLIYFLYAGALALLPLRRAAYYGSFIVHAIDIGTFALLMQLTEGPTSPFFVFFTFALLSATLQWNSQGAIWTSISLVVLLMILSWTAPANPGADDELNRLIMRGAYLFIVGAMLAYSGAFRERDRFRLAKLAAWPQEDPALGETPVLDRSLAHAADVMGAKRLLVVWEEAEEPFWHWSYWDGQGCETKRVPWAEFGPVLPAELIDSPFMTSDAGTAERAGRSPFAPIAVSEALVERFKIKGFASAPFRSTRYNGHVFVLDPASFTPGLLALAEIVASRIAAELEHHALLLQMASAALVGERVRIARDMHDGLLQDLTAAQLGVRRAAEGGQEETKGDLTAVKHILSRQQTRIRGFVEAVNAKPSADRLVELAGQIRNFADDLGEQWNRRIQLDIQLGDLIVPERFGVQLLFILAEAVANAVRHGEATEIDVEFRSTERQIHGRVKDNGSGMAGLNGSYDHQVLVASRLGPSSILRRIEELGGQLQLTSSPKGVQLDFWAPLP